MAGFRGAVEDGIRNISLLVGAIAGGATGYLTGSYWIGLGVFVAINLVGFVWAERAGAAFTARQRLDADEKVPTEPAPPPN